MDSWRQPHYYKQVSDLTDPIYNQFELLIKEYHEGKPYYNMIDWKKTNEGAAHIGHIYLIYSYKKTNKVYIGMTCHSTSYRKTGHFQSVFIRQEKSNLSCWMHEVLGNDPEVIKAESRNKWAGFSKEIGLVWLKNIHLPHLLAADARTTQYPTTEEYELWKNMMDPYETQAIRMMTRERLLNTNKLHDPKRRRKSYNVLQLKTLIEHAIELVKADSNNKESILLMMQSALDMLIT